MKKLLIPVFLFVFVMSLLAQGAAKGDSRSVTQNVVVRLDGTQNNWEKSENDGAANPNTPASGNENVTFNATATGIFVTIISGTNKIRLFALTGQLLLNGDLTQGRFFIPTHQGIYFLRVNNKSYKVICK